jgi:Protein of unknown function (DUF3168)
VADSSRVLQDAIYTVLKNGLTIPVYDDVKVNTTFPYVTIGEDTAVDDSSKVDSNQEFTVNIHVWSRERGRWQAKQIISDIDDLLHEQPLYLTSGSVCSVHRDSSQTFLDPDGLTIHGVVIFKVRVNHV